MKNWSPFVGNCWRYNCLQKSTDLYCLTFFDFFNTSLLSGLLFGLISVVVPWFFFLPATGKGLMGNKTPNPKLTKVLSTCSHVVVGLFLAIGFSLMEY